MSKIEKQKEVISKKLSKGVKAGIAVGVGVPTALAGVVAAGEAGVLGPTQPIYDEAKEKGSEVAGNVIEEMEFTDPFKEKTIADKIDAQASGTIKPTETQETSGVIQDVEKKIRGKINLITEEKLKEMQVTQVHRKYPQEVVYRDVRGPEAMKEAVWYSWALILKERNNDPDFKDIPADNPQTLIAKLQEKLEKGEDLTFDIWLWNDLNIQKGGDPGSPYKVDLTRELNIVFVAEAPANEFVWEGASKRKDGRWVADNAFGYEVTSEGVLTIKIYVSVMDDQGYTRILGDALDILITQDPTVETRKELLDKFNAGLGDLFAYLELRYILVPGLKIENHKIVEEGNPILAVKDIID